MYTQQTAKIKIDKEMVKQIADSMADEMARKMYYKLSMLKYLPEIKEIESKKRKALKGKEIHKFLLK